MKNVWKYLVISILFLPALGMAQTSTQIDPATRINWPRIAHAGSPSSLGIACGATGYGQPYLDISTTPNTQWVCGFSGWFTSSGLGITIGSTYISASGSVSSLFGLYQIGLNNNIVTTGSAPVSGLGWVITNSGGTQVYRIQSIGSGSGCPPIFCGWLTIGDGSDPPSLVSQVAIGIDASLGLHFPNLWGSAANTGKYLTLGNNGTVVLASGGGGTGTVTTTGTPATGTLATFSGATSITNATQSEVTSLIGSTTYDAYGAASGLLSSNNSWLGVNKFSAGMFVNTSGQTCGTGLQLGYSATCPSTFSLLIQTQIGIENSSAALNQKLYDTLATADGHLQFRLVNDPNTAANAWMIVSRSGYAPTGVLFGAQIQAPSITDGTATLASGALSGATTGSFSTSVTSPRYLSSGSAPTITLGPDAGTSPGTPSLSSTSTNSSGTITFTSGTSAGGGGYLLTVLFAGGPISPGFNYCNFASESAQLTWNSAWVAYTGGDTVSYAHGFTIFLQGGGVGSSQIITVPYFCQ